MNRDEIIKLALQAGATSPITATIMLADESVIRFAALVAAAEREACEKIEEKLACSPAMFPTMGEYRAYRDAVISYQKAIRARGNQ